MKDKSNPLLAAVKPLARQYLTADKVSELFSRVSGQYDLQPGEKAAIILSMDASGRVCGAVYGLTGRTVASQYSDRVPVDELLLQLLN